MHGFHRVASDRLVEQAVPRSDQRASLRLGQALAGGGGSGGEQSGSESGSKAVFHAYLLLINVHDGCRILWREVRSSVPMSASAASAMTTAPNSHAVKKRSPDRTTK